MNFHRRISIGINVIGNFAWWWKVSQCRFQNCFKSDKWLHCADQQKAGKLACFERNFCVSCTSCTATLLTVDNLLFFFFLLTSFFTQFSQMYCCLVNLSKAKFSQFSIGIHAIWNFAWWWKISQIRFLNRFSNLSRVFTALTNRKLENLLVLNVTSV